ncbi:SEC14 domain and spectrin repeat-containing protein 1 isoform X2 [Corythoichthys intestinalis]|uniref:SEC14 domain and spectrin repeat-containing protein 1 isoform X2 n=1 Tax=Corythoichthys intestinalis TaxID=161448 RepID=UPI0025A58EE5|nr:SEC14 domain and spectrin repeat-containing protein 1 isoform X2 [Corythoichthys intestinalis]XP_061799816.1 SEC14 domain and spectrin repeat-containing protein 1-B-like [Nerophis lumbriciformis]
MEASGIINVLNKKLAFLSGGKDRRSGLILSIPLGADQTNMDELSDTLDYLLSIPSDKCKARGFTVIVDGRRSQWNTVKTVVLMLQNVIPAEVSLVCVVKPDEFWDKKVTHFCFWKEKDRLGFEVILVSANKLTRYIEPSQLTDDFGGTLDYDHADWLSKRLVFEKFTKESTSLLDELSIINEGDKSAALDKSSPVLLPSLDPETVLQTGHELLSELQQRRFNVAEGAGLGGGGGQGAPTWRPMEEELLAQPQVMKLLDSLREKYTRYQEVCRQRSKRSQIHDVHAKVMQVVTWLQGPGAELLKTHQAIGDSMRAAQALQQKHEEIESQHSEWFAVYVELNQQIGVLLGSGGGDDDREEADELKALRQQLSDVCYQQAALLENRQNVLQAAHAFHAATQELSQQLDALLGMLCADVAPTDGSQIQHNLKVLEEKLQSVEAGLAALRQKGALLLERTHAEDGDATAERADDNVRHVHDVVDDMQMRKQRCEDMVDVRRLKMLQMVQLFKCEEDALQAVEWLCELLDALLKTHVRLGEDAHQTQVLMDKHRKFVDVAQSTYDYGRQLLQATVVLCQSLRCATRSSGDTLPRLNRVWKQFGVSADERQRRLQLALAFHRRADAVLEDEHAEAESLDEVDASAKVLLDRLAAPVIFPDGSEQRFGGDSAAESEFVRERLLLVEERRLQLQEAELGAGPRPRDENHHPLRVIGEEEPGERTPDE